MKPLLVTMENTNPQQVPQDRAALAKAAMLRRMGDKKGGKAKSEAQLCQEKEAAAKKGLGSKGNKNKNQAPNMSKSDAGYSH